MVIIYNCPLAHSSIINLPEAVSLAQKDRCITPLNYLPLDLETNRKSNVTFTVCIPPQLFPIDREMILIEWIELNRLLGADYFVFLLSSLIKISCRQCFEIIFRTRLGGSSRLDKYK